MAVISYFPTVLPYFKSIAGFAPHHNCGPNAALKPFRLLLPSISKPKVSPLYVSKFAP